MQLPPRFDPTLSRRVSILNRLCGRMQLPPRFDPTLSRRVSILNRLCGRMQLPPRFDPTLSRRVSILNRLCGRMQLPPRFDPTLSRRVSILNRLCGRMQPWTLLYSKFSLYLFQSSTGSVAGCNVVSSMLIVATSCFNPQPALWPDATWELAALDPAALVSILNRLCGRMQLGSGIALRHPPGFNPQPALWPDATVRSVPAVLGTILKFQSSTGSVAGCNLA